MELRQALGNEPEIQAEVDSYLVSLFSAALGLLTVGLFAAAPPAGIFAGIACLLLFSNDLKEEASNRAKTRQLKELLDCQKYYESLGVQSDE
jgi:hypothetical protein